MPLYTEYTTLTDIHTMLGDTNAGQDGYYSDLIRSTSRELELICNRRFVPVATSQLYDVPRVGVMYPSSTSVWAAAGATLLFDDDLLEVTSLTNGDGTLIAASQYLLWPTNATPKYKLQLKNSATVGFVPDASGNYQQALTLAGLYGFHTDYGFAWPQADTLSAAIISTTAASFTTAAHATVRAGDLVKIDSEMLYASAVSGAGPDTVTAVRGANGSTAATHLVSAPVLRWYQPSVEAIVRTAVVAYSKLKDNPLGDTVVVGGYHYSTPKDVTIWLDRRSKALGLVRLTLG